MYIFFFGLLVSIDAFVCGISFGFENFKKSSIFAAFSFIISFIGSYLFAAFGNYLNTIIDVKTATMSAGILLILIAVYSFLDHLTGMNTNKEKSEFYIKMIACMIVAVDASLAALSLSLMGFHCFLYIAYVFGLMHGVMIFLGTLLSKNTVFERIFLHLEYFPMLVLFLLGISKIIL